MYTMTRLSSVRLSRSYWSFLGMSLLLMSLTVSLTLGQFPRKCAEKDSISSRRCCPIGFDGSPCNAVSGRGQCDKLKTSKRYRFGHFRRCCAYNPFPPPRRNLKFGMESHSIRFLCGGGDFGERWSNPWVFHIIKK